MYECLHIRTGASCKAAENRPRNSAILDTLKLKDHDKEKGRQRRKIVEDNRVTGFQIRITTGLQEMVAKSNCQTVGELARRILCHEKANWYHIDARLESTALELAGIRSELNAMGRDINQITHHFHTADETKQKMYDAFKVAQDYRKVEVKIDQLLQIAARICKKWLSGPRGSFIPPKEG